ncbi:hypothetical protein GURASL_18580 [Geotalea uraniireducens]|uniref:Uncharacterized protein n=1 Tax=Geotalea uraniireducens TaxID=351604 RepID=A0ABM8EKA6_9BACT|nr:hypothetical protein GURASL_18580 [Geotalea uraniireducens]
MPEADAPDPPCPEVTPFIPCVALPEDPAMEEPDPLRLPFCCPRARCRPELLPENLLRDWELDVLRWWLKALPPPKPPPRLKPPPPPMPPPKANAWPASANDAKTSTAEIVVFLFIVMNLPVVDFLPGDITRPVPTTNTTAIACYFGTLTEKLEHLTE